MIKKIPLTLISTMALAIAALVLTGRALALVHERVIYSLTDNSLGPRDKLLYTGGSFYGTTPGGGHVTGTCPNGCGTVFELSPGARGWTYNTLYEFRGGKGDGASPVGNIVMDSTGNIYGATEAGGLGGCSNVGCGTAFKLTPGSNGRWTESVIQFFSFQGGSGPQAGVTLDTTGNLYGTTTSGGHAYGSVYELIPNADGSWSESVLYRFGALPDGEYPRAEVTLDAAGNVYGTTSEGGSSADGIVFELTPNSSGGWTENVLYEFTSATGCNPVAQIWIDPTGSLYGTAEGCGQYNGGVVYELTPNSGGSWTESTVHNFGLHEDGVSPQSPLTPDTNGNLWGTTLGGGALNAGTVYKLKPSVNGGWTEADIYNVQQWGNGSFPPTSIFSAVTFGSGKTLYGTASSGGVNGQGAIYEITQ